MKRPVGYLTLISYYMQYVRYKKSHPEDLHYQELILSDWRGVAPRLKWYYYEM